MTRMIEIIGQIGKSATEEEIQEFLNRRMRQMNEKTCGTCIDNDCGLCDRKGILVEDDDVCEKHRDKEPEWKQAMMRTFLAGH